MMSFALLVDTWTVLCLFTASVVQVSGVCDIGWTPSNNSLFCYRLFTPQKSWSAAKDLCHQINAWLADLENADEQKYLIDVVLKNVTGRAVWLGASDREVSDVWRWVDNSTMLIKRYRWRTDNPDNGWMPLFGFEDCLEMYLKDLYRGLLNDYKCFMEQPYVCKSKAMEQTTQSMTSQSTPKTNVTVPILSVIVVLLCIGLVIAVVSIVRRRKRKQRFQNQYEDTRARVNQALEHEYTSMESISGKAKLGACAFDREDNYESHAYEGSIHFYQSIKLPNR